MQPALLVIDIQNEYLKYIPERDRETGLFIINTLIEFFRVQNQPIYRIYHQSPEHGTEEGKEAFEFPGEIRIEESDPQVIKHYPNAFKKTGLDEMLRENGINTLFLCGLSAVGCVMATYWGALDLDYLPFMIREAVMSHSTELTGKALDITEALSPDTVGFMLKKL